MKAVARGKEKIMQHTWNAAQEMHRISTGRFWALAKENYPAMPFRPKNSFGLMAFGERPREFINAKRIAAQEQVLLFNENETRHHAGSARGVSASTSHFVIGAIEMHQQVAERQP